MSPTKIEWSEETWNPTTGCDRVSPGCAHCYALTLAARLKEMGQPRYQKDGGRASGPGFGVTLHPDTLTKPLSWKKPRRVFVNSMSDLFHEEIPDEFIYRVFEVMAKASQHTFQILTKRPERMRRWVGEIRGKGWPLPNVWLGVTVENQHWADERIPILLDTPAAVRFVSYEPALGPLHLDNEWLDPDCTVCGRSMSIPVAGGGTACPHCFGVGGRDMQGTDPRRLDWVIVGGESGPKHRLFDPDWARSVVAQCREAGVAAFVKQLGGFRPGTALEDLPEDLRVREYPA